MLLEYSLDMHCMRGEFGKEIFWLQTLRRWNVDASGINPQSLSAKEVLTPQRSETYIPNRRWNSQSVWERPQGNSQRSQPTESKDDAEARNDCWSIQGDFIYHHHVEPRVQLYVPKEETFPIPLSTLM